jgi:hypothetical protein
MNHDEALHLRQNDVVASHYERSALVGMPAALGVLSPLRNADICLMGYHGWYIHAVLPDSVA